MLAALVVLCHSLGPLHGSTRFKLAARIEGDIVRTDRIPMYGNAVWRQAETRVMGGHQLYRKDYHLAIHQ